MAEEIARLIIVAECVRRFKWTPSDENIKEMMPQYLPLAKAIYKLIVAV